MGSIHGILPGDKVITNVDVFRKLYEVVGLGWVYAITRIGFINTLANRYVIVFHVSTSTCSFVYHIAMSKSLYKEDSCECCRVYALWAKYRLPITGRPDIETVLRQRKETCKGS